MFRLHQLTGVTADIVRLCIWLMLFTAVFVPLERLFPIQRQKIFRPQFITDLCYYFVNNLVPKFLLIFPMAAIAWGLHFFVPAGLNAWVAGLPLPTRLIGALVVGEVGFYWGHRWTHEIPLLWRFHSIHHSAASVDWLVNTRAHPVDIIFTRLCGFVPMYVFGFTQPMLNALDPVALLVLLIGSVWGFFIHANLRVRLGWLGWVVSTPAFHHWHHTNDDHRDRNYASMLPVFDLIFGTLYLPAKLWPVKYGIDGAMAPHFAGQLAQPFLRDQAGPDNDVASLANPSDR